MEPRRPRILFVAEAVTLAHVVRPLVLARSLDPARYDVHLAWDPRYNRVLGELPGSFRPIRSMPSERFFAALLKTEPIFDLALLKGYVEDELPLLRELAPDAIVGDFRFSLAVSARVCKIPYLGMINAYWSPHARPRFVIPDVSLTRWLGPTLAQALYSVGRPFFFAQHAKPFNRLRDEYGVPRVPADLRHVFTDADHTLYPDVPELVPTSDLPSNHHYIGPVLWSPAVPRPEWWERVPTDRPIVYVTLGSSGQGELVPLVAKALAELPVSVLLATAGKTGHDQWPPNVFAADYLSGDEACARSKLVVCNGGSPTAHQALAAGVPVLGIASNSDQFLNMHGIVKAGAGQVLRAGTATAPKVRSAAEALLAAGAFATAAKTLADTFAEYPAADRFQRIVDQVLRATNVEGHQ